MTNPSIITKAYDLLKYLIVNILKKVPKDQRFLIGSHIQAAAQEVLELVIAAYYSPPADKKPMLAKVNIKLEILRHYLRLCFELGYYDSTKYKFAAEQIDEIGRMAGSWLKSIK